MALRNSLGLGGDGDEVDLVEAVERAFRIAIDNDEAATINTVGKLHDVVVRHLGGGDPRRSACLTAVTFYRLRRALRARASGLRIAPGTALDELIADGDYDRWREGVEASSGLRLPPGAAGIPETAVNTALALGSPIVAVSLVMLVSDWGALALLGWPLIFLLDRVWTARCPRYCPDVGSLARNTLGLNFAALSGEFGFKHRDDLFLALSAAIRENTGFSGTIDRDTTFFA